MAAFNQTIMLGNLTRDVQLGYTDAQTAVAEFGLAVNRRWLGQDGKPKESVCYIEVKCFGRLAENCSKYLVKGAAVLAVGHLDFESWEKDGCKHSRHRLVAETVQFLTPLNGANQEG